MVYSYSGLLLNNKKEQTNACTNLVKEDSLKKNYIMNDLIYMKFLKRQNCSGKEEVSGCQVVGVRKEYNFQGSFCSDWTFLFLDGGGGYTNLYTYVQTMRTKDDFSLVIS